MVNPPINDLNRCRAILMLRTAKCTQDAVAAYIGTSKKNVVAVDKWFRELPYEEALEVCFNHALDCVRPIELDHLNGWVPTENQNRLNKMDAISVLGRYGLVKIREKRPSILHPRPSEHHARLARAAEKLRQNIRQVKETKGNLAGNIIQGYIQNSKTRENIQTLQDVDRFDAECLLSHLITMYPEFKVIGSWEKLTTRKSVAGISPYMLRKLRGILHGKALEGTCEICRSWYPRSGNVTPTIEECQEIDSVSSDR